MAQAEATLFDTPLPSTSFIEVILPVPIPKIFTYRVPKELTSLINPGQRVVVPFGSRNILTGIIKRINNQPPKGYEARLMIDILEEVPAFSAIMLQFMDWMAAYYMANQGDVLQAAIPAGLKVSSESFIQMNPNFDSNEHELSKDELRLLDFLSGFDYKEYNEVTKIFGKTLTNKLLKLLYNREAILFFDTIRERYKPRTSTYIRLTTQYLENPNLIEQALLKRAKKPKQEHVILTYLKLSHVLDNPLANEVGIKKEQLVKHGCSPSSIQTLINNHLLEDYKKRESRFDENSKIEAPPPLSKPQEQAIQSIFEGFESRDVVFLHGITGSGKTEIYVSLISKIIEQEEQALFLVPEIALTTQLVIRLKKIFGNELGVYHSRYSDNERVEVWQGVQQGIFKVVIGVRSSLFLPFSNLGLVIVDEEHEPSYKQINPSPRYNARDAALVLARLHHAKVLMGSATPSVESFYNAMQGKYYLVTLNQRYGQAVMPQINIANVAREQKKKTMKGYITHQLFIAISDTLANKKQVIIFQNRRGYAPFVSCTSCGWTPQCHHCDVSLTYHLYTNELKCHYCGQTAPLPTVCSQCKATEIKTMNFGTEQLEESLQLLFPNYRVARMDQDTTKGKHSFSKLIEDFSEHSIDILVGTQMVAKGLDFAKVQLVGIFDFDRMLHFPDFRAAERTFSLVSQVAGRAGRRKEQGQVIIQTYDPTHKLLEFIKNHDYNGFYKTEIKERAAFEYPPFVRLIKLTLTHKQVDVCANAAGLLAKLMSVNVKQEDYPVSVYGPVQPVVSKIRNKYIYEILLKINRESSQLNKIKIKIWQTAQQVLATETYKTVRVSYNVDPI